MDEFLHDTEHLGSEGKIDKGDQQMLEAIYSLLPDLPRKNKVLVIGPGVGQNLSLYRKMGYDMTFLDIEKLTEHETILCDVSYSILPFAAESFDLVIMTEVLEHLENHFLVSREISRVLKPKGQYIFSTPYIHSIPQRLFYLFKNIFLRFGYEHIPGGHINPVHMIMYFNYLTRYDFKIKKYTFNRGWLPLLRIEMPKNDLWGDCIVVRAEKGSEGE